MPARATRSAPRAARPPHPAPLRAHLFGSTRLAAGDRDLPDDAWPRRSARALLLLLLATPGHRVARDRVLDTLWPDAPPDRALTALYTALHTLRRVLEPDLEAGRSSAYVEARGGSIALGVVEGSFVDVDAFRAAIARGISASGAERVDALREAVALHVGDFLTDEPYADWPMATRERLRRDWRRAVLELADVERTAGRPLAGIMGLEVLLASDPTDEAAHRALMLAHAAAGRRDDALRQYELCTRSLRDELDADPGDETRRLAESIANAAQSPPPTLTLAIVRPARVPVPPTRLIGRAAEVDRLRRVLADPAARLVTIVGPGGVGKTRLALEVAQQWADLDQDGVAFVSLADVRDTTLLLPTIARGLGIEDLPGVPAEELLRDAVYQRQLLLVLDNLEHLTAAAPAIGALLEGAPNLRLLATSREPLHLRGERVHPLGPLPVLADPNHPGPRRRTEGALGPAVELFAERVRELVPEFELDPTNAAFATSICDRLDGLPLAIELAAGLARHLDLEHLLRRLDHRLPLLAGGPRDLPDRLRSMRSAIAWSHDLLDDDEQRLFRRLAVFVGECSMEAAEAVAGDGSATRTDAIHDLIGRLADKSLIRVDPADGGRVTMLATIREFALDRLAASDDEPSVRSNHAAHFLSLAEQAAAEITGPEQARWLARLEAEHDNLRTAFDWLVEARQPELLVRLVRALGPFWEMHGHLSEGRRQVERALAIAGAPATALARAMTIGADLAQHQGDYAAAEALQREAGSIFEQAGDRLGEAESALGIAAIAFGRSDLAVAAEQAERALMLFEEAGDRRRAVSARKYLANIAFRSGALEQAGELWHACVTALRDLGDERGAALALGNLGVLDLEIGHLDDAVRRHREALAVARRLGDTVGVIHPLINLGRVLVLVDRIAEARTLLDEAIATARGLGDPVRETIAIQIVALAALAQGSSGDAARLAAEGLRLAHRVRDVGLATASLEIIASVALAREKPALAARLLAASEGLRAPTGARRERPDQEMFERDKGAARQALEAAAFDSNWAAGAEFTLDAAVAEALAFAETAAAVTGD